MDDLQEEVGPLAEILAAGCLLLASLCLIFTLAPAALFQKVGIPILEVSELGNLQGGVKRAANYILEEEGRPIPADVDINPELANLALLKGYNDVEGQYYQLQAAIAAADNYDIDRADFLALMHLTGGFYSDIATAHLYITALRLAVSLREMGYLPGGTFALAMFDKFGQYCVPDKPCIEPRMACFTPNCGAIRQFIGDSLLDNFVRERAVWGGAARNVSVAEPGTDEWQRFPALTIEFWHLENIGIPVLHEVEGIAVIVIGPGAAPPNELPNIPDGMLIRPCQGGMRVSGHTFGRDHLGNEYPEHTGTDVTCGDGWVRASLNGEVTVAQYIDPNSGLAGELWDSGNVVVVKGELPDGTPVCSGSGHGANLLVEDGDDVRAGDVLFAMGETGLADGAHDHWFIRIGGEGDYCSGGDFYDPTGLVP